MTGWTDDYELCANLWLAADVRTKIVMRFGIRLYSLDGDDDSKLSALQAMARTDYFMADWFRIPDRYRVVPRGPQPPFVGAAMVGELRSTSYWEEAFDQIWNALPPFHVVSDEGVENVKLPSPKSLLRVETVLWEFPDGRLMFPPQNGADTVSIEL